MADYWKSQDRKYCDFCKCWIADNKPSVQFHENGKRHKDNVSKRLSDISRRSAKKQKEAAKLDMEMKKMEAAAMRAYMKDIASNPDYSSQEFKNQIESRGDDLTRLCMTLEQPGPKRNLNLFPSNQQLQLLQQQQQQQHQQPQQQQQEGKKKDKKNKKKVAVVKEKKRVWFETMSAQGHLYYWNSETKQSSWIKPEEFISLDEQKMLAEAPLVRQEIDMQKADEERERFIDTVEDEAEIRSWRMREEIRKAVSVVKEEEPEPPKCEISGPILGPDPKPEPYGKWTVVKQVEQKVVDLQLPKQEFVEINVPPVYEPKIKIKEKQVTSLEDEGGPSSFKKRKPNPGRMNIRRRLDDDD